MADRAPELGELEREVMQLVWAARETTADAIRERVLAARARQWFTSPRPT